MIHILECHAILMQNASVTMRQHVMQIVNNILSITVDAKVQIKIELFKLMKTAMLNKGPQIVTEMLVPDLDHRNPRMKEDVYNYIIYGLLTFPSSEYDLDFLLKEMLNGLMDQKRRVRQASLEATALIFQVISLIT